VWYLPKDRQTNPAVKQNVAHKQILSYGQLIFIKGTKQLSGEKEVLSKNYAGTKRYLQKKNVASCYTQN
jgi:hypothetical protein